MVMRNVVRYSSLFAVALVALAGCSTSGNEELAAPTMKRALAVTSEAAITKLGSIETSKDQLCPVTDKGELLVFSGTAKGPKDGSSLTVNGTTIKPGDKFETGSWQALKDGFDCGGKHYDKAFHVLVEQIQLSDQN